MHRAFDLRIDEIPGLHDEDISRGMHIVHQNATALKANLAALINGNESIDGTRLQNHWFPRITADVFISHSHKNEKLAINFAGWISRRFKLKPFIDSCVW